MTREGGYEGLASGNDVVALRLEEVVEGVVGRGVGLVACQRVVHPALISLLQARGVVVLDRLSNRHYTSLLRLSGASSTPSASLAALAVTRCGILGGVQRTHLGGKSLLHAIPPKCCPTPAPVTTLLLAAPSAHALAELSACCHSAIRVLAHHVRDPRVVAGAGLCEASLLHHLRLIPSSPPNHPLTLAVHSAIVGAFEVCSNYLVFIFMQKNCIKDLELELSIS